MRVNGLYGHVRSNDAVRLRYSRVSSQRFICSRCWHSCTARHVRSRSCADLRVDGIPRPLGADRLRHRRRPVRGADGVARPHRSPRTDFRFVDDQDEPRLCRIVEPLIIAAGLPTPYVGVIDTPALNAFACGIRQKDAVLVFTRGLIDGLDDDELAAVAAHEIVHIKNGDIRLIAATNVCLDTLNLLQPRPSTQRRSDSSRPAPFRSWPTCCP